MNKKCFPLTTVTFKGPRFEDHRLDVAVLPEVVAYQRLLVETAKELWRSKNPDRERLPKKFEDKLVLKIARLEPGSVALPLEREVAFAAGELGLEPTDELSEAVSVIDQVIAAADNDGLPPANVPARVIPLFAELGKCLEADETFQLQAVRSNTVIRFDHAVRERIAAWHEPTYSDDVDLLGEVTSADVEACGFTLKLDDGKRIPGRFSAEQEQEVTEALRGHRTLRLRVKGRAEFLHRDATIRRFLSVEFVVVRPIGSIDYDPNERPIWEIIDDLIADVPAEEFDRLPLDGAENHDRYLHHGGGAGK